MGIRLQINGQEREFESLQAGAALSELVSALGFRQDRVALEQNGEIVPRAEWPASALSEGDRLEVVHFVGGGCGWGMPHPASAR